MLIPELRDLITAYIVHLYLPHRESDLLKFKSVVYEQINL